MLTSFLNSIDPAIIFMTEEVEDGGLTFLDTNTCQKENRSLKYTIYWKVRSTDQYLNFTNSHPLIRKLGVVRTLYNRANYLVNEQDDREKEKEHFKNHSSLHRCEYHDWVINLIINPKPCPDKDTMNNRKDKAKPV